LRRTIQSLILAVICGTIQLVAQAPYPQPSTFSSRFSRPHAPAKPAASAAPATPATIFDATRLGSPVMLDKGWRVGITANPSAALPGFDDSAWALRDAQGTMDDVPDEDQTASGQKDKNNPSPSSTRRYAWFRLHLKLAPNHGPVALLVELPVSQTTSLGIGITGPGADIFANGKLINPEGTPRRPSTALSIHLPHLRSQHSSV
jgi:hypothetical protein